MTLSRKEIVATLEKYSKEFSTLDFGLAPHDSSSAIRIPTVVDKACENIKNLRDSCSNFLRKNNFRKEADEIFDEALMKEDITVRELRNVLSKLKLIVEDLKFRIQSTPSDSSAVPSKKQLDPRLEEIVKPLYRFYHNFLHIHSDMLTHPHEMTVDAARARLSSIVKDLEGFLERKKLHAKTESLHKELPQAQAVFEYKSMVDHVYLPFVTSLIDECFDFPEEILALQETASKPSLAEAKKKTETHKGNKIFIVHGHDEVNLLRLKELLKERFKLSPAVIVDTAGKGRHFMEMIEQGSPEVCFAFILMTPDDKVKTSWFKGYRQPRPNVFIELGWFYGTLDRKRVCILVKKGTNLPTDIDRIKHIEFNRYVNEALEDIEKELKAAELI